MIGKAFLRDILRPLLRRKGITIIVILTLALGVGVNAGVFSVFHQILLQELAVPDSGQIVVFDSPGPRSEWVSTDATGPHGQAFSYPLYKDLRSATETLDGVAAFRALGINLGGRGHTSSGRGLLVSGNYFDVLDLKPEIGRFFGPDEQYAPGTPRVTVLGHALWQERFGGDPSLVGENIMVNGQSLEVIGIAPANFGGLNRFWPADLFVPVTLVDDMTLGGNWNLDDRRSHWVYVFGRLADGLAVEKARASLAPLFSNLMREVEAPLQEGQSESWMQRFLARELDLLPAARGQSNILETVRTPLILMVLVAGLVLLVACVNITNLLLAMGAAERGETAVRQALGAGRRHILGHRLSALLVLAGAGALISLPVAFATVGLVAHLLPASDAGIVTATLDLRIMAVGLVASVVTIALAGAVPILQAIGTSPVQAMRDQVARSGSSRVAARLRSVLVTTQIAMAVALLVVSGLFIRSLVNISSVDLGLEPDPVLSFSISPARSGYSPARSRELFRTLEQRLGTLPGVASATVSAVPILTDSNWGMPVSVEGFGKSSTPYNAVGPDFFSTLSIPLLRGRGFDASDVENRPRVAVVNTAFMRKFDLGRDAIGKRIGIGRGEDLEHDIEIVGVVADAAYSGVKDPPPAQFFIPMYQTKNLGSANFYLRTVNGSDPVFPAVRRLMRQLDPNLPVDNLFGLETVIQSTVVLDRVIATLALVFAALATALAAVGLFGVLTFATAQRTGEIGLRAALGAAPAGLHRMVLAQTLRLALVGGLIGLVLAWFLGSMARGLLYELSPLEPLVMLGAVAILFAVVLLAGWLPARRAASVQPVQALRHE